MADAPRVATPEQVEDLRKAQETEWGTYIAIAPITFNGAPAYNAGAPVPVSNVKRHKYDEQGLVAKVGTKAADQFIAELHAANTADQSQVEVAEPVTLGVSVK